MEELKRIIQNILTEDKELKKTKAIQVYNFNLYKNSICNLDALSQGIQSKGSLISFNANSYTIPQLKELENEYIKLYSEYQVCRNIHKVLDQIFEVRQKKFFSKY